MSKDKYYIIYNSDGDTTVTDLSREELLHGINTGKYSEFIKHGWNADTNYWGDCVMIIKGSIVHPEAIQIVKEYTIE